MTGNIGLHLVDLRTGKPLLKTEAEREAAKKIVEILEPLSEGDRRAAIRELQSAVGEQYEKGRHQGLLDHFRAGAGLDAQSLLDQIRHLPLGAQKEAAAAAVPILEAETKRLAESAANREAQLGAVRSLKDWITTNPSILESPQGSVWHKLVDARNHGRLVYIPKEDEKRVASFFEHAPQVFVVEHNWAAAFAGAGEFTEGSFRLPFDFTCFEFKVSGRRLCLMLRQAGDEHERIGLFQAEPYWVCYPPAASDDPRRKADPMAADDQLHALSDLIYSNVRAVCIALDAEVAVSEPVRAPEKLNVKRARKGKPLLRDYHVISLARRSRSAPPGWETSDPKRRVRLHFRRGHWRHYENHKTWIKWQLVGNPDLGFIDKHYRL